MNKDEIVRATDRVNGSKFSGEWTLERYAEWLRAFLDTRDWTFPPSQQHREYVAFDRTIGIAGGVASHTIAVVVRGRYVHAYPVEDL